MQHRRLIHLLSSISSHSTDVFSGVGVNPQFLKGSHEQLLSESATVEVLHSAPVFVPGWSLRPDSCFFVRSVAFYFTLHALPPATVDDMDSMSNVVLAHNLAYAAGQAMTYLSARSHCVLWFGELERVHSALVESEVGLMCDVADLRATVCRLESENKPMLSGKLVLEDMHRVLKAQVES